MLTEVADGTRGGTSKPEIDIVAVHGLNPFGKPDHEHAVSTWQKPKGQNGKSWLSDALPAVLPTARVFIYEYEANPTFNLDKTRFISRANELLERLRIVRRECPPTHPLIFLGHSLGGIMVKQALVNAHNNSRYSAIKESTYGLVFFGTPHRGGNAGLVGLGDLSIRIARGLFRNPPNDMMDALRGGSMFEDVLQENWRHQLTHYKIVSFYEKYKQGSFGIIVDQKSATFGLGGEVENQQGLRADHSNLCCFDENDPVDKDNLFLVMGNLEEVARAAIQDHRHKHLTAPWIVPFDAKPGQELIGRSAELQELAKIMAQRSERSHTVALVHGEHGCGKSLLVLEYCRKHREKYPAGIFWVVSTSKCRLLAEYSRLQTALGLDTTVQTDQETINAVKFYFGYKSDWLIVLDGGGHLDYLSSIASLLPAGAGGSIIITTAVQNYQGRLNLGFERGLRVMRPTQDGAADLFLAQVNADVGDQAHLRETVSHLATHFSNLPLAVNIASRHCFDNRDDLQEHFKNMQRHPETPYRCPRAIAYLFDQIRLEPNSAWPLLCALSFLDLVVERNFLATLIDHTPELKAFQASHILAYALSRLEQLGLLQHTTSDDIHQHTAVQRWIRRKIAADKCLSLWHGRTLHVAGIIHYTHHLPGLRNNQSVSQVVMVSGNYFEVKGIDPSEATTWDTKGVVIPMVFNLYRSTIRDGSSWFVQSWRRALNQ